MNTESLVDTGIEKEPSDLIREHLHIKPAANIARCFECEASYKPLTKYILLKTDDKILLCSECANNMSSHVERPMKLSKKQKRKLRTKGLDL